MRRSARHALCTAVITALATAAPALAQQDAFPTRAVRMIVPFPVAGATDILARVVAQKTGEQLGQQVVVDNRPGAGGTLGSRVAVSATPDGYTLLMGTTSTHAIGPHLYSKKPYDPLTDFTHVTQVATSPNVLLVAAQVPAQSIKELVALAKSQPGKLNFGSSGTGTQFHLSGELLKLLAGINIVHVPYKGTALVYPEMISGTIQILFDVPPVALPFIKQGRVRALGVSGRKRAAVLPDVPTIIEAGIAGYDADLWFGLFAPPKTRADRVTRVHREVVKALGSSEVRERFATLGADGVGNSPAAFSEFLAAENAKWQKVVIASGAKID
ncbi:MAG: tripartite tricarboxylate transporter substrate binding protein [Burkholderiales bacterium]|nr:tripartite tricarboxylate transporter substrate binding protein [Burkholderiales bacterium]